MTYGHDGGAAAEATVNMAWVSTALALLLAVPPMAVLLGIYFATEQLILGAVLGFAVHFATLALSPRISEFLTCMVRR